MKGLRFWTIVALLGGTALILQARGSTDRIPATQPLSRFPQTIAERALALIQAADVIPSP